jgi:hypothetical protein
LLPNFRLNELGLHLMLDHDGLLPSYAVVTDGKQHEVTVAASEVSFQTRS